MRRHSLAVGCLILGCASARFAWAEVPDPLPLERLDENSPQRALYKKAQSAFEAGDFEQARGLFLQANAIQPRAEIALGLGQTEFELKRYRDCAEHLDFAIHNLGPNVSEAVFAQAKRALAEAKAQVAVLNVATQRNGAEITVDGKPVGTAPLSLPVYLEPGAHEIAAHLGQNGITRPVAMQAGEESSINLTFASQGTQDESPWSSGAPRATSRDPAVQPAAPEPSQTRSLVPVVIGGAVFLASATAAVLFRIDSESQFNDADALMAKLGRTGCPSVANAADCAALATANKNGDRSRNWSTAAIVVAGGSLLGTIAYWYWPAPGTKTSAAASKRVRLGAGIAPNASGIFVSGNF